MHAEVARDVRLEVESHLPANPGKDGEEVPVPSLRLQHVAQSLNEPGTLRGVTPAVEARNCTVSDEEVCVGGNLVRGGACVVLCACDHLDPAVQPVTLACLNEEHLWFAGQGWTLVRREVGPQVLRLVRVVGRVQNTKLSVGKYCDEDTVCLRVVLQGGILQDTLHLLTRQIVVYLDLEVQLSQYHSQIIPVIVCSFPGIQLQLTIKVHVVEDKCLSTPSVLHVVVLAVLVGGHRDPSQPATGRPGSTGPPSGVSMVSVGIHTILSIYVLVRGGGTGRYVGGQAVHDIHRL